MQPTQLPQYPITKHKQRALRRLSLNPIQLTKEPHQTRSTTKRNPTTRPSSTKKTILPLNRQRPHQNNHAHRQRLTTSSPQQRLQRRRNTLPNEGPNLSNCFQKGGATLNRNMGPLHPTLQTKPIFCGAHEPAVPENNKPYTRK